MLRINLLTAGLNCNDCLQLAARACFAC